MGIGFITEDFMKTVKDIDNGDQICIIAQSTWM